MTMKERERERGVGGGKEVEVEKEEGRSSKAERVTSDINTHALAQSSA